MSERINLTEIEERLGWIADEGEGYFGEEPQRLVCAERLIASIPALVAWVKEAKPLLLQAGGVCEIEMESDVSQAIDALLSRLEEERP